MENSQNQKHTISLPILQAVADPRSLRVIVLPTEQCNFRCTYCYEDFKIGHMSKELVKALKAWLLSRSNDLHQLTISWFGGEPMLALPTVLDVTRTLRYAFENQGKSFISGMTTNGYYLNEQNFNSLLDSGVTHFQITLDGPRHIHDRSRILANGEPTFEVIWQNLTKIAEIARSSTIDFHVDLRIHYDGDTAEAISPLVAEIKSKLLTSKKFAIQFHEVEPLGGPNDDIINFPTFKDHEAIRLLSQKIKSQDALIQVTQDLEGYICYAAKANAFVLRADGRIGKCTVALNDPRNDVGKLNLDGTIVWNDGRLDPWLRGLHSGDSETLACPLAEMQPLQNDSCFIPLDTILV